MAFTHINERMCTLRIKTKSITNVHAPTEDSEETEIEQFYSQLEMKTKNGDLITKLGREEICRDIIGREAYI